MRWWMWLLGGGIALAAAAGAKAVARFRLVNYVVVPCRAAGNCRGKSAYNYDIVGITYHSDWNAAFRVAEQQKGISVVFDAKDVPLFAYVDGKRVDLGQAMAAINEGSVPRAA